MKGKTIYGAFKNIVERYPDKPAIYEDNRMVTFSDLDKIANGILSRFAQYPQQYIGIVMNHGIMQIAAMLAVLKSGAAYVPAEPTLPRDRIKYMMRNAGVKLIITDYYCKDIEPSDIPYPDVSTPDGIAYVLYTSGTTGKPKGVMIENHSVVNYAAAFEEEMKIQPGDVMLQYSICSFDIFIEEVFATLLNGAAIAIPSKEIHDGSLDELMEFCSRHNVTILDGFPYFIADLNRQPSLLPPSVKLIISGGDVVRANYINRLKDRNIRIYNTYGPSETTVCSNYYRIDNADALDDGTFPIGKAVKGVTVKILDEKFNECPIGQIGEICIIGEGVGHGYLGNPPEQVNYVTLNDGSRFYRSGDMGFLREDGNFIFLRRRDDQVMILGRRVEPDEVENVINEYPEIAHSLVKAFKDTAGLHYLIAYIVPEIGFSLEGLKSWLRSKLADFMIPEFFVALHHIPITPRGKVNVDELPVVLKEGEYK